MKSLKSLDKFIVLLVFFGLWEAVSRLEIVNPLLIPPFSAVVATTWDMLVSGNLLEHMGISLYRAFSGMLAAIIIGVPLGLLLGGWFRRLEIAFGPLLEIFSQTNPFILFHIILLFLGIGEATKVVIIAWTCIWPIVFTTISGIKNVNPLIIKAAAGFGLGRFKMFYKIVLPCAAPSIFTGLRLSAGYTFFMLIAAEIMGCESGLGWLILNSQENYDVLKIFSGAFVIALLSLTVDLIMELVEIKIFTHGKAEVLNSAEL